MLFQFSISSAHILSHTHTHSIKRFENRSAKEVGFESSWKQQQQQQMEAHRAQTHDLRSNKIYK